MGSLEQVASSRVRLRIASMLAVRPRTLSELASATGISIQGVLKHLTVLEKAGLLKEVELNGNRMPKVRKLYSILQANVGDYSEGNLMIAHLSRSLEAEPPIPMDYLDLEDAAEDILLLRRRVRDTAKRMERTIRELDTAETSLSESIGALGLTKEEQVVARVFFTEVSAGDAKLVLTKYYGCEKADKEIENVIAKIKKRARLT